MPRVKKVFSKPPFFRLQKAPKGSVFRSLEKLLTSWGGILATGGAKRRAFASKSTNTIDIGESRVENL
jgi:hypothetical protein